MKVQNWTLVGIALAVNALLRVSGATQQLPDVEIRLQSDPVLLEGVSVARWVAAQAQWETVPEVVKRVEGNHEITVPQGCLTGSVYVVHSPRVVSAPFTITEATCRSMLSPPLFFAAEIAGGLSADAQASLPNQARLHVDRCSFSDSVSARPVGVYPVSIATGRWSARVPADCLRLSLDVEGFVPVRWPVINLSANQRRELGVNPLQPAAAVRAAAQAIEDRRPLSGVRIDVIPDDRLEEAVKVTVEGGQLEFKHSAITGADGSGMITGLPAGLVYLRLTREDRAPVFTDALELVNGMLSKLEPVALSSPAQLEVEIVKSDVWPPPATPLTAVLFPRVAQQWITNAYKEADITSGRAEFRDLIPGAWRVDIHATTGQQRFKVAEGSVELTQSGKSVVAIDLRRSVYQGYVTMRGSPLEAHLEFSTSHGIPSYADSTKDGAFLVALATPGTYRVAVTPLGGGFSTVVPNVIASHPAFSIEVRLPENRLRGTVRNQTGTPVSGAAVGAKRLMTEDVSGQRTEKVAVLTSRTDASGAFVIDSVPEGRWEVLATLAGESSDPIGILVPQDSSVTLTLRKKVELIGRVVTDDGMPVVAAPGTAAALTNALDQLGSLTPFWTTANGEFQARLDRPASAANLAIFPHELPVSAFRVPVSVRAQLVIPRQSGAARITFRRLTSEAQRQLNLFVLISPGSGFIPLSHVVARAGSFIQAADRSIVHAPRLFPGSWTLVKFASIAEGMEMLGRGDATLPVITSFYVTPGAVSDVVVP